MFFFFLFFCFRQLSWAGAAAWQPLPCRATSQKHPYKCYCAHLIDLSQARGRADRLTLERNGKGTVGEQTSKPVFAAEEAGAAGGWEARLGWRTSCRQMPAVTFPDYGFTQAGIPATVQGQGGNEDTDLGLHFTTHMGKEKEQMYASAHAKRYALNMKLTLSDNKDLSVLSSLHTNTNTYTHF